MPLIIQGQGICRILSPCFVRSVILVSVKTNLWLVTISPQSPELANFGGEYFP